MAAIRKSIKSPVARRATRFLVTEAPDWIPRITRRRGKHTERLFWQSGGGYDRNVTEKETLLKMIEYIHMNPVRRRLADRSENWKWSSASRFYGGAKPILVPDPIPPEWLAS